MTKDLIGQKPRGAKVMVPCLCCRDHFEARVADRKRGWAKFCSKSCKASWQEQRTGQFAAYRSRREEREESEIMDAAFPFASLAEHDCNKD